MSVTRQYTPINPLDQTKHFDVIIKVRLLIIEIKTVSLIEIDVSVSI
jgi:hypothetical protein